MPEGRRWGGGLRDEGGLYIMTEDDLTMGGGHIAQYTSCNIEIHPKTYMILLTNVPPIDLKE